MRILKLIICIFISVSSLFGCAQSERADREPLPELIWPAPPDLPRIKFVNSVSVPEDLRISESAMTKFLNIFSGAEDRSIVRPYGVEADADGRIYVVDSFKKIVHVYDVAKKRYYTFPDSDNELESPIDIAIQKNGRIFISDSKKAGISVFSKGGSSYDGFIGDGALKRPTGIAINDRTGELLVVDTESSKIVRFGLEDLSLKGHAGGDGAKKGMFHFPTNIFVSRDGRVFVSDSMNFRVQIFSAEFEFLGAFGKVGSSPGFFSRPRGIAVDSEGNIYVVDALFDNIQIFNVEGQLLMDLGGPGYKYGEFWLPSGIFIDGSDRIYVSDTYNKRVQIFQYIREGEM